MRQQVRGNTPPAQVTRHAQTSGRTHGRTIHGRRWELLYQTRQHAQLENTKRRHPPETQKVTTAPRQPAGNAEETHHRVNTHTEKKTQQSRNVGCALRVFNIHLNDAASAANQRPKTARPGQTQELQERSRFTKWHTRATPINKWANGQYTEQRMGTHTISLP